MDVFDFLYNVYTKLLPLAINFFVQFVKTIGVQKKEEFKTIKNKTDIQLSFDVG